MVISRRLPSRIRDFGRFGTVLDRSHQILAGDRSDGIRVLVLGLLLVQRHFQQVENDHWKLTR